MNQPLYSHIMMVIKVTLYACGVEQDAITSLQGTCGTLTTGMVPAWLHSVGEPETCRGSSVIASAETANQTTIRAIMRSKSYSLLGCQMDGSVLRQLRMSLDIFLAKNCKASNLYG